MELLNTIFIFFTDRTKKLSHKSIMILFTLVLVILIDNSLSFSYNYNNTSKLEQIEKLNSIIIDSTLSKTEKNKLITLRNNIINHETWKDKLYNKLISIDFKVKDENKIIVKNDTPQNSKERNYWIHFITSSWILMILIILMPLFAIFDKQNSSTALIFTIIFIFEPLLYIFSWCFAKLFSLIPVLYNNPFINYAVNFILHTIILLLIGFLINYHTSKKEKEEKKRLEEQFRRSFK
ncbi:hypothetical protein MUU74_00165 [Chryseobacterium daecheongense]|uniref:hypothetical protein n=1 Tax=Chryseobacterium daecheongense TaxID=192389 RepID=UPI001FD6D5BC|nr:hypothetical protein [Chryseobacterium daecheongense]UOU98401.1 hypothetical protein MUU74_00165 [Chryseobacterium daecheongense]